jgi:hypothetical protein
MCLQNLYGAKNMNMISTGAFQTEIDATTKQPTIAEKFAALWEKKNAKAARAGGVSLMALSLAACGSDDGTTTTSTTTTDTTTTTTPTVDAAVSLLATTGSDNLVGGSGDDTFRGTIDDNTAANNTLTSSDTLSGGAGADTLNLIADTSGAGIALPAADISGIETINVRNVSGQTLTVNTTLILGEETVNVDRSSAGVTVTNVADGVGITITGDSATVNGAVAIDYLQGATNKVVSPTITITGDTTGGDVDLDGTGITSVSVVSTGGTNVVAALDLQGTIAEDVTITATTNLDLGTGIEGITAATGNTFTVSGAATSVDLGSNAVDADVDTIDASGLTAGGITATMSASTTLAVTGGSGNDTITSGAVLTTGSANAGAGTGDKLVVGASTHVATAALGAKYSGFETLQVGAGVAVDTDNLTAGNTLTGATFAAGGQITDMNAAMAANVTAVASGTYVIGVKNASTVGQLDTVNIDSNDGAATASTVALGTPTLTGVETVGITATDAVTVTALTSAASLSALNVSGAAAATITTGALAINANMVVDGSGKTAGALTFNADASTGRGMNVTGGAGGDTITMSDDGLADVINGGAGADTIRPDGLGVVDAQTITVTEGVGGGTADTIDVTLHGVTVTSATVATTATPTTIATTLTTALNADTTLDAMGFSFTSSAGVITVAGSGDNGAVADPTVNDGNLTGFTFAAGGTNGAGGTDLSDTITGGTGKDVIHQGSSSIANIDTVVGLDLGGATAALAQDTLVLQGIGGATEAVATATSAQATAIAATASLTAATTYVSTNVASADGNVAIFTYGTADYLFVNGDGGDTFTDGADILMVVTGYTGTLDVSDFSFV